MKNNSKRRIPYLLLTGLLCLCGSGTCAGPQTAEDLPDETRLPAFPGAEGFGRYAVGGRGGQVYHVTTLADGDGMPDAWEKAHRLNPADAADGRACTLSSEGYTNLEVYLNGLVEKQG